VCDGEGREDEDKRKKRKKKWRASGWVCGGMKGKKGRGSCVRENKDNYRKINTRDKDRG
jgi:hypothetical protein